MLNCNKKTVKKIMPQILNFMRPMVISDQLYFELSQETLLPIFGFQGDPLPKAARNEFIQYAIPHIKGKKPNSYFILRDNFLMYEKIFYPNRVASTIADMAAVRAATARDEAAAEAAKKSKEPVIFIPIPPPNKSQISQISIDITPNEIQQLKTGVFEYHKKKSVRLWHRLQTYKKEYRNRLFYDYGYRWDYDINASAPTLLLQAALKLRPDYSINESIPDYIIDKYPEIYKLIYKKLETREQLALDLDLTITHRDGSQSLDIQSVKELLHGLLMGGKLKLRPPGVKNKMAELLRNDINRIEAAQQNEYLIKLQKEFTQIWTDLFEAEKRRTLNMFTELTTETKKSKKKGFNPKEKCRVYSELEDMIRSKFMKYATIKKNRLFQIHDGFISDNRVSVNDLSSYILRETGYQVTFSENQFEQ